MKEKELMDLAYAYYIGDGYTFDRIKALEIYEELAHSNVEAMYYAGMCLFYLGKRNKLNYQKAYDYFIKASKLNHKKSIDMLEEIKKYI